ncbi:MAG: hypothetical protein IKD69_14885 [Solobacterium sp.]|nr:hypothetical protein [Solobacterium sp.]
MSYYFIRESLIPCSREEAVKNPPYVAVLTVDEYIEAKPVFNMGIDMDLDLNQIHETKAIVNYDSLTGTLNIPDHINFSEKKFKLAFALDETGIILIDNDDYSEKLVEKIHLTRKWRLPSLERFLYDFLEETIIDDPALIENIERELSLMEDDIMKGRIESYPVQLNDIRYDLLDMHTHYEHMMDVAKELEENENNFFQEDNLRYFRLLSDRAERLNDQVVRLREYISQLRDLVSEQLSIRQNNLMTYLTVIATIFMPLTLITGWFGMNFQNMPELTWQFGYPGVIVLCILIVIASLIYFRRKKWL